MVDNALVAADNEFKNAMGCLNPTGAASVRLGGPGWVGGSLAFRPSTDWYEE